MNLLSSKPNVLVTAIGTMTSSAIVSQLKASGQFYIIGADIYLSHQVATSMDVDEFYVFPSAVEDLDVYLNFVLEFCVQHEVDYYFANIDEEVVNLSRHRDLFSEIGVKLCIPNEQLVETCHFKNVFSGWVSSAIPAIAIREFHDLSAIHEDDFPLFIKPIEGRASIGCKKLNFWPDLKALLSNDYLPDGFLLQEFVDGDIITADLMRNASTGQRMAVLRLEEIRNRNGCGIAVEIIEDPKLIEICCELMEKLDLDGVANAEFVCSKDGYRIIEVNPRFSAGSIFTCMAGYDIVMDALRIASNEPCEPGSVEYGARFARRYEAYRML